MTVIAFDLDGTISDPAQGITASINYALAKIGWSERDESLLLKYIGPPLNEIFADLLDSSDGRLIDAAVAHYRERYVSTGYRENVLYDGVRGLLEELLAQDYCLYVATSKREDIACSVVDHFDLRSYFKGVLGCGSHKKKSELLSEILDSQETAKTLIMIGDRSHDMIAGAAVSARCVGVLWGYGSSEELTDSGAEVLVKDPIELLDYIDKVHNNTGEKSQRVGLFR